MTEKAYERRIGGVTLHAPFMNSAGSLHGNDEEFLLDKVAELARSDIGAIVIGSFTVSQRNGNAGVFGHPVYYYDPNKGATYNSKGLPGPGIRRIVELAPKFNARADGKPLIYSGSTTIATSEIGEGPEQISRLAYEYLDGANAKIVEVDAGCPHVLTEQGGRMPIVGYDYEVMEALVDGLKNTVGVGQNIGIKLPPYMGGYQRALVPRLAKLISNSGVFTYIATSNTIPDQVPRDELGQVVLSVPGGKGGMSGPATKPTGREQLRLWRDAMEAELGSEFPIVSSLGVDGGKEAATRLQMGATTAAATTLFLQSLDWMQTADNAVRDLRQVIGEAQPWSLRE